MARTPIQSRKPGTCADAASVAGADVTRVHIVEATRIGEQVALKVGRIRRELVGKEKVMVRGAQRDLLKLNLTGENFEWNLWLDPQDQFKLIRVAIPADDTEVVRD